MIAHEKILALVASLPGPACAADIYAADRGGVFESEADAASKLSSSYTAGWLTREKRPNPKAGKHGARKEVFFYSAGVKPIVQEEADEGFDADAPCCQDYDHYGAWLRINDEIEAWQTIANRYGIKTPEELYERLDFHWQRDIVGETVNSSVEEPYFDRNYQIGGDHYAKLVVQPWDVMRATFTPVEFQAFLRGNVIKYLMRDKGDRLQDLRKAQHYLATLIGEMEAA